MDDMGTETRQLNGRTVGQYDISIATSLALEGAMDIYPDRPKMYQRPPLPEYDQLWINLKTLFRNVHGSMDKNQRAMVTKTDFLALMLSDMAVLDGLVSELTQHRTQCVFYACNYMKLGREFPKAMLRSDNTDLQKAYTRLEADILTEVLKNDLHVQFHVLTYDVLIKTSPEYRNKKVLILTNLVTDLLSRHEFGMLDLLESHTGIIKKPPMWYTKLHGGNNLTRIPFDRMTLQMFGDSSNPGLFRPFEIAIRHQVLDIAEKFRWNPTTTKDRIIMSVRSVHNPSLETLIKDMYH